MTKEKTPSPIISVRVSVTERKALERAAGKSALSAFMRDTTLLAAKGKDTSGFSRDERNKLAARILNRLGQTQLRQNLEDIAVAAKLGTLPLTDDIAAQIVEACETIKIIRDDLLVVLGLRKTHLGEKSS